MTLNTLAMPEAEYHASPGLSATGMKWILRSPAHYRARMAQPGESAAFDIGHAVHAKILGVGADITVIPEDILASNGATSTKEAKAFIAKARGDGLTPIKADVLDAINATAEAVLTHPKAARLLALEGPVEVSLFATDPDTGVSLRGRLDKLATTSSGRLVNVDIKTTTDVRRHKIRRAIEDYGYDIQSETYRHLIRLTHDSADVAPTHLIFVEKEPPHEVRVIQLAHEDWITGGAMRMRRAINTYARCIATDTWPGDDDGPGAAEAIEPRPYYLDDTERDEP